MTSRLNRSVQQTVDAYDGGPIQIPGVSRPYVVMSLDVFEEAMGIQAENEPLQVRKAVDRGLADLRAGRMRPWKEVYRDLKALA